MSTLPAETSPVDEVLRALTKEIGSSTSADRVQWLQSRSTRLARGLASVGAMSGEPITVLCCHDHREDQLVAIMAVRDFGATAIILPLPAAPNALQQITDTTGARIHLACVEGVEYWKASSGAGMMIGDAPEVTWWKALEARNSKG